MLVESATGEIVQDKYFPMLGFSGDASAVVDTNFGSRPLKYIPDTANELALPDSS
jgi:hypothetical protein